MARLKFKRGAQKELIRELKRLTGKNWFSLARSLNISKRALFDWAREKYLMPVETLDKIRTLTNGKIYIPIYKVLPDFWHIKDAGRKGGIAHFEKYGSPGTSVGRRLGGLTSQINRKLHPELYPHCNIAKEILTPKPSEDLAELFGIILGDGGIGSNYQVIITLHRENDALYKDFVCSLIKKVFGLEPAVYKYHSQKSSNIVGVTISSVAVLNFLFSMGLKKGNKVKQQVGVPAWILENKNFSVACMRGLIDTDGGVYHHKHKSRGHCFFNLGMAFANRSLPLLGFVKNQLEVLHFHPKMNNRLVNLYREEEVKRYAKKIKFHNIYHFKRLRDFEIIKGGVA